MVYIIIGIDSEVTVRVWTCYDDVLKSLIGRCLYMNIVGSMCISKKNHKTRLWCNTFEIK